MTDFSKKFRQVNYAYAHKNNSDGDIAPKNDIGYGPWPSKEEAWTAILSIFGATDEATDSDDTTSGRIYIPIGIVAGVAEFENGVIKADSDITEYQLKGGHKYANFNEYNSGGGTTYSASDGIVSDLLEEQQKIKVDFGGETSEQDTALQDIMQDEITTEEVTVQQFKVSAYYNYSSDVAVKNELNIVINAIYTSASMKLVKDYVLATAIPYVNDAEVASNKTEVKVVPLFRSGTDEQKAALDEYRGFDTSAYGFQALAEISETGNITKVQIQVANKDLFLISDDVETTKSISAGLSIEIVNQEN